MLALGPLRAGSQSSWFNDESQPACHRRIPTDRHTLVSFVHLR